MLVLHHASRSSASRPTYTEEERAAARANIGRFVDA
jgi:hypothetical protein